MGRLTAKCVSKFSGERLIFYIKIGVTFTQVYVFVKSHEKLKYVRIMVYKLYLHVDL